jgi:hypothetical protein
VCTTFALRTMTSYPYYDIYCNWQYLCIDSHFSACIKVTRRQVIPNNSLMSRIWPTWCGLSPSLATFVKKFNKNFLYKMFTLKIRVKEWNAMVRNNIVTGCFKGQTAHIILWLLLHMCLDRHWTFWNNNWPLVFYISIWNTITPTPRA